MTSDSSYYETTYSEDERYEQYKREKQRQQIEEARRLDQEREQFFEDFYENNKNKKRSIFNLKGINFIKFTHKRIKFSFQPCRVARLVSTRVIFYITLRYRKKNWLLKRDSIPANYKLKIYSLFYTNGSFSLTDDNIKEGIWEIWKILRKWAQKEHLLRQAKYQRYQNGEDVYLDKDDEDLFLSDTEIEELHEKREAIWERMLPPAPNEVPVVRIKKTRRPRIVSSSSSSEDGSVLSKSLASSSRIVV